MCPVYSYRCDDCDRERTDIRKVDEREDGPECDRCRQQMQLILSPTAGYVRNPAAGHTRAFK